MSETPFILVLGMHRSGTSVLAQMLGLLGLALPRSLMPGDAANPTGYGESLALNRVNERILAAAGSRWNDWRPLDADWQTGREAAALRDEAGTALRDEFPAETPFVLKDPRVCRLVPLWGSVFAAQRLAPRVVIPLRHPLEVAASLRRRDGLEAWQSLLLWARHLLDAEAATRRWPRALLTFDGLLEDWRGTLDRLGERLAFTWPRATDEAAGPVAALLAAGRPRRAAAPPDLPPAADLPADLARLFDLLAAWAVEGERAADHAELDALRARFAVVTEDYARLLGAAEATAAEAGRLAAAQRESQAFIDEHRSLLRHQHRYVEEQHARLKALDSRVAAQAAALLERDRQLAARDEALAERDRRLAAQAAVLAERDGQLATQAAALADRDRQLAAQALDLEARRGQQAEDLRPKPRRWPFARRRS